MYSVSHLNRVLWIVALAGALALPSTAQQPAAQQPAVQQPVDLQKQLEQLKQ